MVSFSNSQKLQVPFSFTPICLRTELISVADFHLRLFKLNYSVDFFSSKTLSVPSHFPRVLIVIIHAVGLEFFEMMP